MSKINKLINMEKETRVKYDLPHIDHSDEYLVGTTVSNLSDGGYSNMTEHEATAWINWYNNWNAMSDEDRESMKALASLVEL